MLLGISWVEARDPALETKENLPQQGILVATGSVVLRLRNPALHSENESHTAWLQNGQTEAPRMFQAERPSWAGSQGSCSSWRGQAPCALLGVMRPDGQAGCDTEDLDLAAFKVAGGEVGGN